MITITPKEQKTRLLADIDTAIMAQATAYGCDVKTFESMTTAHGPFNGESTGWYKFCIPPNIEYNIVGNQLFEFKKQVKRIFPNKQPILSKPTKYKIQKPRKRVVAETKTYQSIINPVTGSSGYYPTTYGIKPMNLKAADVDPALKSALRHDIGSMGIFATGTPTFIGFINWLLEHPLTPVVFEKLKRSYMEKDFKLEILQDQIESKRGLLMKYAEDLMVAIAHFNEVDAIRNKVDDKELTLRASGYKSGKALRETHSRQESIMLSENAALSDLKREIAEIGKAINKRR